MMKYSQTYENIRRGKKSYCLQQCITTQSPSTFRALGKFIIEFFFVLWVEGKEKE